MTTSSPRVASRRAAASAPEALPDRLATTGVPLALGAVGTLVALLGSWNVSLWAGEAAIISAARRSTAQLLALVHDTGAVDAAYPLLIHFWGGAFGWSAFSLRLPSAIAAGLTVVGVWALCRALGRADVAVLAGTVAVVLPRITWMGTEAGSAGLSAAAATWATVALVVALRRGGRAWIPYAALVGLGTTVDVTVVQLAVAHVVAAALLPPPAGGRVDAQLRRIAAVALAAALGLATALPVLLSALHQQGPLAEAAAGAAPLVAATPLATAAPFAQFFAHQWFVGETPAPAPAFGDGSAAWSGAAVLLAAIAWSLMIALVVASARGRVRHGRRVLAFLLPWLLLPAVVVSVWSLVDPARDDARGLGFCAPAAALMIGFGIASVPWHRVRVLALAAVIVLAAPIYLSQRQETGKGGSDWASTSATIAASAHKGDAVYFAPLDSSTEGLVERTTRDVAVAYPDAFRGLIDLTVSTSPTGDTSLRGTSAQLSTSTARLDGIRTVWEIAPTAGDDSADAAFFESRGYQAVLRHVGPLDTVIEYRLVP